VDTGEVVPVYGSDGRMMVIRAGLLAAGRRKSNAHHGVDRGKVHRIIAIDIALNDLDPGRARLLKT